jgi:hypothetical protein
MASEVDICNRALQKLGASRIISRTDNTKEARACNFAFDIVRDSELRIHNWNFAVKRVVLAEDTSTPDFGYGHQFQLPSDWLRNYMSSDSTQGSSGDVKPSWKTEGKKILTDDGGSFNLKYIARVEDTTQFDSLFVESLAAKMAYELAEELTQSNTKKAAALEDYNRTIREAKRIDAIEDPSDEIPEDSWITARL